MQTAIHLAIRVGRATVVAVGLGVSLALLLGIATMALAAVPGDPFKLGKINKVNAMSTLIGNVDGPLLTLKNTNDPFIRTFRNVPLSPAGLRIVRVLVKLLGKRSCS